MRALLTKCGLIIRQSLLRKPNKTRNRNFMIAAGCESPIYCNGKLLSTIQNSGIFADSKAFVDMKMKSTVFETVGAFNDLMAQYEDEPSREVLEEFVSDYFEPENELEDWFPIDFNPEPRFLHRIPNPEIKNFAKRLVWLWPKLGRKLKADVFKNPDKYSLIPLRNGIIVPGQRSKEMYYWDTYWILNGLLISEMYETARGLLDNFIYMVKIYGFVPNGGRIYYAQRSQPPLLIPMVAKYISYTNDMEWLRNNIIYLNRELKFWRKKRLVNIEIDGGVHQLAHYAIEGYGPRPEDYNTDVDLATHLEEEQEKEEIYSNIKSAVQSGWNFSSRWIYDENGEVGTNLSFTQTKHIIPVDLNAYLHVAFISMSYLFDMLDNHDRKVFWRGTAQKLANSMMKVLYNEADNIWYDYNMKLKTHRKMFYTSNLTPLWSGAYPKHEAKKYGKMCADYLKRHGILSFQGGIPTSLEYSDHEWDFPTAMPPMQAIIVQGLEDSGHPEAIELARELAIRWIHANLQGFKDTGEMLAGYNCVEVGKYAGNSPYLLHTGFGWTNGVALQFITKYFSAM